MGQEWKPNEEKTQLELISQVSASISAVREGGEDCLAWVEGLDTPGFGMGLGGEGKGLGSPKGLSTTGEAHGNPQSWVSRCPGGSFSPSPSFLLHPFPAR